ncbi:MAG: hypothetical protein NT069_03775 [Planctomycetota bacterium]|nr:hypothetical protein [Planctomycetota bacterium]
MAHGVNVVALVKGNERYIFLFDNESEETMLRTLGRFASDSELSFTWYDAAVLSQKVRRIAEETTVAEEKTPSESFRPPRVPR